MSMTSGQAQSQICPLSNGEGQCDGWTCPRWVVERQPSGAICCQKTELNNGAEYIPDSEHKDEHGFDVMRCKIEHDVTNCRECPAAYGHCAG